MPRHTWDDRNGRRRPQEQRSDWRWLLELLASERRYRTTPQTPGDQRRRTEETP
jgi:hypothetical protein